MKIAVVGTGYVGLVAGACFAAAGTEVTCVDVDEAKLRALKSGSIPFYEPGLETLVKRTATRRLHFTSDLATALDRCEIVFVAVGTPPNEDGSADLSHVLGFRYGRVAQGCAKGLHLLAVGKALKDLGERSLVRH